jgi:hypothetical protein
MLVVFSTNLDPTDLADEAFLRRIHNKIFIDAADAAVFDDILRRIVASRNIPAEPDTADYLRRLCLRNGRTELRACYPRDICDILASIANYEGRAVRMTRGELERASDLYFTRS